MIERRYCRRFVDKGGERAGRALPRSTSAIGTPCDADVDSSSVLLWLLPRPPLEQARRLVEIGGREHHRRQRRTAAAKRQPDIAGLQSPIDRAAPEECSWTLVEPARVQVVKRRMCADQAASDVPATVQHLDDGHRLLMCQSR